MKPWENEPDEKTWEAFGYRCEIIRTRPGHLCGYVTVPKHHWAAANLYVLEAHGGINYVRDNREDNTVTLGFDCGHLGDLSPNSRVSDGDVYRTMEYVTENVESLAEQLYRGQQNYIERIATKLSEVLESQGEQDRDLLRIYALLILMKPDDDYHLEDIHNAWAVWRSGSNPLHKSLVPFDDLTPEVQALDQPFLDAVRQVSDWWWYQT